jgi:hypothetical protein
MTEPTSPDPALARLERALAAVGADDAPPLGWQSRVLAARAPAARPRWRLWLLPAAALALVALWLVLRGAGEVAPQLAMTLVRGGPQVRAEPSDAQLGDTVQLRVDGARHRALWLYREGRLLAACPALPGAPSAAGCEVAAEHLELTWPIAALGRYVAIAAFAERALPTPRGELDVDVSEVHRAGAEVRERGFEIH